MTTTQLNSNTGMMHGAVPFHRQNEGGCDLFLVEADTQAAVVATIALVGGAPGLPPGTRWRYAVGPRPEMTTSWCSNVLSVLGAASGVRRIERYRCYAALPSYDALTERLLLLADADADAASATMKLEDGVVDDIAAYNARAGLGFDERDVEFYRELFGARSPTVAELHDLSNCNSEHSRHHLFRGRFTGGSAGDESLMDLIRRPLKHTASTNSVVAMVDNASAIRGWPGVWLTPQSSGKLEPQEGMAHITFTAETHNFPTGIAPFQGATTGVGGRIRDTQAIGRGGSFVAGTAGYCVGRLQVQRRPDRDLRWSPVEILLQASDGASDYGNKIGEPLIQGFTRSYGDAGHEWLKPVMFSGGIGRVASRNALKRSPENGMAIVRVGGPTYRIGIGGGAASSIGQSSGDELLCAVQRGDPQLQNRMDRWLRACLALPRNPIVSIHDQGAGGMGNVTKEIAEGVGARVDLKLVELGDASLSDAEIWVAESQEQNTVLIAPGDLALAGRIAAREGVELRNIGTIVDTGRIQVTSSKGDGLVVDLPLSGIDPPRKTYALPKTRALPTVGEGAADDLSSTAEGMLYLLRNVDVGSKRFLTTKVDRSVGGLVAQQQCVGPQHVPVADVAVVAHDHFGFKGAATAIGEQPVEMLRDMGKGIRKAVAEMCTNLVWAPITAFEDVKCSVNWMWPAGTPEGKATLLLAVQIMSDVMCKLGIAIDGGKDSVSMTTRLPDGTNVDSPPQVVVSGYAGCTDIRQIVTPGFKGAGNTVYLITCGIDTLPAVFAEIQALIRRGAIVAGHDVSDGGLVACLAEMCFASENNNGVRCAEGTVWREMIRDADQAEAAVVVECVEAALEWRALGHVTSEPTLNRVPVRDLRDAWETVATELESYQTKGNVAQREHQYIGVSPPPPVYRLPENCLARLEAIDRRGNVVRAAVIRGEGSNGDREMAAALWMAGFEVHDVTTSDLTSGRLGTLDAFQLAVFVGGFTYSDVLGAAAGWGSVLTRNEGARTALETFRQREDTLTLGVCNGCQLLARLGWVSERPFVMQDNVSGRFESRFVTVAMEGDGVWFKGMHGAQLGVWTAHGEGRFPDDLNGARAKMRYVDNRSAPTMQYPLNPNGSAGAVAGVTSSDGRVLALMPHPERCVKRWQLPWMPKEMRGDLETDGDYAPWLLLFRNAAEWCLVNTTRSSP